MIFNHLTSTERRLQPTKKAARKGGQCDSDAIWHKCHIAAPCHGPINKEKQDLAEVLLFLVIPTRFERVTHSLEGCCSIQLSYGTILNGNAKLVIFPLIANVEGLYCTKLAK